MPTLSVRDAELWLHEDKVQSSVVVISCHEKGTFTEADTSFF